MRIQFIYLLSHLNFAILSSQGDGSDTCPAEVIATITKVLSLPAALSLPLGQAYIASRFNCALRIIKVEKVIFSTSEILRLNVVVCKINKLDMTSQVCNITLWGRLVGPEILSTKLISLERTYSEGLPCYWKVEFPAFEVAGEYKVELRSIWFNALVDPEANKRGVHTSNDGKVVHLGGIGSMRNRSYEPPNLNDIRLNDGDPEREASHIFGSPFQVSVIKNISSSSSRKSSLPLCTTGATEGRWVFEPACNVSVSSYPIGHECWQTDGTYQGHNIAAPVRTRSLGMVWRPYDCRLTHFAHNTSTTVHGLTPAARALLAAKIGIVAGFGDSLGIEQAEYFKALVNGSKWSNGSKASTGWLECDHWQRNHHWLHDHENLIKCINKQVSKLLKLNSLLTTVVLVTNFNIHHGQWKMTLEEVESHLQRQSSAYKHLRVSLAANGLTLRCIWFSGVAIHGFRVPGLTPARQQWINSRAKAILGDWGGWEVLDAYSMTEGRPDGSCDGVHYRGGVAKAIATVLMNILCNSRS